jgi:hypothetical protein
MDTKRCAYCHKLQRASAQVCRGCGHAFIQKKPATLKASMTLPSIPPASPHRAGHYSGLHPEDQPYISSYIAVQHPQRSEPERRYWAQSEPQHIVLPATNAIPAIKTSREKATPVRITQPTRSTRPLRASQPTGPTKPLRPANHLRKPVSPPRSIPNRHVSSQRIASIMLITSCLLFVLASSIIAFVLLANKATPVIKASPDIVHVNEPLMLTGNGFGANSLMIFTYDNTHQTITSDNGKPLEVHANNQGNFSVSMHVPADWPAGAHFIQAIDEAQKLSISTQVTVT